MYFSYSLADLSIWGYIGHMQQPSPLERQAQANLIRLAKWWQEATGWSLSTLSRKAHSDPRFFDSLIERHESGKERSDKSGSVTFRIYDRMILWFYNPDNYPNGKVPPVGLVHISHKPRKKHNGKTSRKQEQATRREGHETGGLASDLLAKLRGG